MPVAKKYINILSSGEDSVQRKKSPIEQMSFILSVGLSPAFPGLVVTTQPCLPFDISSLVLSIRARHEHALALVNGHPSSYLDLAPPRSNS